MLRQSFIIAARVMRQLVRDRKPVALILVVPLVIMFLIGASLPDTSILNYITPALLATLSLIFGFLLTSVSFLRERFQGTMERPMAAPVSHLYIVLGYLFGFFVFALAQTLIIILFTIYMLDASYYGDLWQIFIFRIIIIIGAVNLGIFISTFARNEFQVVQFIPLLIVPQIFLCGVIWPVEQMPGYLQWLSNVLPLTYAMDVLREIMVNARNLIDVGADLTVLVAFAFVMSILATLTV
ncbi:ABC transporter permease [Chloroflexota bacterium]